MRTAARRRPRSRRRPANGDADDWGVCFRYPRAGALFVLTLGTQQFAIASANECKAALYEADCSAAQIVRFPAVIGAPFSNRSSAIASQVQPAACASNARMAVLNRWHFVWTTRERLVPACARSSRARAVGRHRRVHRNCHQMATPRMGVDRWRLFGRDTVLICPVRRMACHPSEARRIWPTAKPSSG